MKAIMSAKCDRCGKTFHMGNRPDGLPNGVGFQLQDGSQINLCTDCMINYGKLVEEGKDVDPIEYARGGAE